LKSKTIYSLRKTLDECFPLSDDKPITKRHILAAQSLLKLNKYQETALKVITEVINNEKYYSSTSKVESAKLQELQELAVEALGEMNNLAIDALGGMNNLEDMTSAENRTTFQCVPCGNGKQKCPPDWKCK
jgi:hypothetical protein